MLRSVPRSVLKLYWSGCLDWPHEQCQRDRRCPLEPGTAQREPRGLRRGFARHARRRVVRADHSDDAPGQRQRWRRRSCRRGSSRSAAPRWPAALRCAVSAGGARAAAERGAVARRSRFTRCRRGVRLSAVHGAGGAARRRGARVGGHRHPAAGDGGVRRSGCWASAARRRFWRLRGLGLLAGASPLRGGAAAPACSSPTACSRWRCCSARWDMSGVRGCRPRCGPST